MWKRSDHRRMLLLALALMSLVACGASAPTSQPAIFDGTPGALAQAASSAQIQSTLRLDGSSALLPLMRLATDVFQSTHPNVHFIVAGSKSSAGRQLVCAGSIDIGTSDVPFSADEKSKWNCADAVEIPVALQAFIPVANPHGPGSVTSLTKAQLVGIFSGAISNWKDVGGEDQKVVLVNRVAGSGTRANMAKYLFDSDDSRFGPSVAEGENAEVVEAVRDTPGAISYVGVAYLSSADMRVFAIDGVQATRTTIQAGTWPISSRGYAITKGSSSAAARAFLMFLTSPEFQNSPAFNQLGFIPITE